MQEPILTIQLVMKYLHENNYVETYLNLQRESNTCLKKYPQELAFFKKILLKGDFGEAIQFIQNFEHRLDSNLIKKLVLKIYKQKLYELLENPIEDQLRNLFEKEIINVCGSEDEYQHLFTLLTCRNVKQIPGMNEWSVIKGRYKCFEEIGESIEQFFCQGVQEEEELSEGLDSILEEYYWVRKEYPEILGYKNSHRQTRKGAKLFHFKTHGNKRHKFSTQKEEGESMNQSYCSGCILAPANSFNTVSQASCTSSYDPNTYNIQKVANSEQHSYGKINSNKTNSHKNIALTYKDLGSGANFKKKSSKQSSTGLIQQSCKVQRDESQLGYSEKQWSRNKNTSMEQKYKNGLSFLPEEREKIPQYLMLKKPKSQNCLNPHKNRVILNMKKNRYEMDHQEQYIQEEESEDGQPEQCSIKDEVRMNMAYLSQNNDSLVHRKEEDSDNFTFSQHAQENKPVPKDHKRKKRANYH